MEWAVREKVQGWEDLLNELTEASRFEFGSGFKEFARRIDPELWVKAYWGEPTDLLLADSKEQWEAYKWATRWFKRIGVDEMTPLTVFDTVFGVFDRPTWWSKL